MTNQTRQSPNALEQFKLEAAILGLCTLGALATVGILYESSTWNPEYTPRNTAMHSTTNYLGGVEAQW